jgi:hypothetical protein
LGGDDRAFSKANPAGSPHNHRLDPPNMFSITPGFLGGGDFFRAKIVSVFHDP